jgi:hypothetical protein
MNTIIYHVLIVLIVTFFIKYNTPMPLIGFSIPHNKININKIYMAVFISLIVTLTDIILNQDQFMTNELIIWSLILTVAIIITYYLIKEQIFVNNSSYLMTMIEQSKIDIKMAEKMLAKQDNNKIKELIEIIIKNRQEGLNDLTILLKEKIKMI